MSSNFFFGGLLEAVILKIGEAEPIHNYGLRAKIREKTGLNVPFNTLRDATDRLLNCGYLEGLAVDCRAKRRYYVLTQAGKQALVKYSVIVCRVASCFVPTKSKGEQ